MDDFGQNSDDQSADKNEGGKGQAQEYSAEKNDFTSNWYRGHVCYTGKNLSTFYPHPEISVETEVKSG